MILINLLPDEHRQKKRAPLRFLGVLAAVATVNASLIAFWAWTAFGVAAEVGTELTIQKELQASLVPMVTFHEELDAESSVFQSREATLKKVTESRVSWTAQVDHLVDLINHGGDGDRYLIWLDGLAVDMTANARAKAFGMMKAQAHSGTANITHVANFLEDVEASPLADFFNPPQPPTGSAVVKEEGLMPSDIWNFPLEMTLKDPTARTNK